MQPNFRDLLTLWDESADKMSKDQIKNILDGGNFVLFFKKDGDLYAAPESSRVVYATMKNPDEETTKGWIEEANFTAIDLNKALEGLMVKKIFNHKDIKDIQITNSEEIFKTLVKKAKKLGTLNLTKVIRELPDDEDDDDTPPEESPDNIDKLGER